MYGLKVIKTMTVQVPALIKTRATASKIYLKIPFTVKGDSESIQISTLEYPLLREP